MDGFDEEEFKKFFPTSFGKQTRTANVDAQIDRSKRTEVSVKDGAEVEGPGDKPKSDAGDEKDRDEDGDDDDEDDDDDDGALDMTTYMPAGWEQGRQEDDVPSEGVANLRVQD